MPMYDFTCPTCGLVEDHVVSYEERDTVEIHCPHSKCEKTVLKRMFSTPKYIAAERVGRGVKNSQQFKDKMSEIKKNNANANFRDY